MSIELNKLWDKFPIVKKELIECKKILNNLIDIPNKDLQSTVMNLLNKDAKLIRPALMIISAKLIDKEQKLDEKFLSLCSSFELIHTASLIHDDIIDNALLRRGVKCVHLVCDNKMAVYAGDFLFTKSFSTILKINDEFDNSRLIIQKIEKLLNAEFIQMEYRYNVDINEAKYYEIIEGKTAILLSLVCYEGAYFYTKNKELALKMYEFGYNIGMAFQLIDDLIDLKGTNSMTNKSVNKDFVEGYYTLPIIKAIEYGKKDELFRENANIYSIAKESGAISYVEDKIQAFTKKAQEILLNFDDNEYRKIMLDISKQLLKRKY